MLRHLCEIQPEHVGWVKDGVAIAIQAFRACPPIETRFKNGVGRGLFGQCFGALVIDFPCLFRYVNAKIIEHLKGYASAYEYGRVEGKRLVRCLGLMVKAETRDERAALREAHDTIIGAIPYQEAPQPFERLPDRLDRKVVPERVIWGRVKEVHAGGGVRG